MRTVRHQRNADEITIDRLGYEFTGRSGSRDAAVEAADAMENMNYLAFGVWLREDSDANDEYRRS